jgi:hypothetical protein
MAFSSLVSLATVCHRGDAEQPRRYRYRHVGEALRPIAGELAFARWPRLRWRFSSSCRACSTWSRPKRSAETMPCGPMQPHRRSGSEQRRRKPQVASSKAVDVDPARVLAQCRRTIAASLGIFRGYQWVGRPLSRFRDPVPACVDSPLPLSDGKPRVRAAPAVILG